MKPSHLALWKQTKQLTDQCIFNRCVDILYAHLICGYCLKRNKNQSDKVEMVTVTQQPLFKLYPYWDTLTLGYFE